jgi:quercetin dioxygenase-like cupin family protein
MTKKLSERQEHASGSGVKLTRRTALLSIGAASLATVTSFKKAHGIETAQLPREYKYRNDGDQTDLVHHSGLHEGKGVVDIKFFFRGDGAPKPALLLLYTIPPGASEGVHTHKPGDAKLGSFDEFYYILTGSGEMQIDGQIVPVKAGDHVFTPNGVAHGIENTSSKGDLKVYLVAMIRD